MARVVAIIATVEREVGASTRGRDLAARLDEASVALVGVLLTVGPDAWSSVPGPGVWSIGKDAEHVAEAAGYHQWIVRLTIGEKVGSRRPSLERAQLVSSRSQAEMIDLIRARTEDGKRLLLSLTDEQLDLPTRPPRARGQRLAQTIEGVLIGHYGGHRADIEAKLQVARGA